MTIARPAARPRISVITPAHERPAMVRTAIDSLRAQTLADFECLIVDDASPVPLADVVADAGDDRFTVIRSERNLGPAGARRLAYERAAGDLVFHLDSDHRAYPWALERAWSVLEEYPQAGGVAGLAVRDRGWLPVRVRGGRRLETPDDYRQLEIPDSSYVDMVGVVRRSVVGEWLAKGSSYFALEFHHWLTFQLRHAQVLIDEPWVWAVYDDAGAHVSQTMNDRQLQDLVHFVEEHHELIVNGGRCLPLDRFLMHSYVTLSRRGRTAAADRYAAALDARGIPRRAAWKRAARRALATRWGHDYPRRIWWR